MTLKQVIDSDTRMDGVADEIQRWLRKIPVIEAKVKEGQIVPFELIESLAIKLGRKYDVHFSLISFTILQNEIPWYSTSIVDNYENEHKYVKTVYGLTMYELYSKAVLFIFAHTRRK